MRSLHRQLLEAMLEANAVLYNEGIDQSAARMSAADETRVCALSTCTNNISKANLFLTQHKLKFVFENGRIFLKKGCKYGLMFQLYVVRKVQLPKTT